MILLSTPAKRRLLSSFGLLDIRFARYALSFTIALHCSASSPLDKVRPLVLLALVKASERIYRVMPFIFRLITFSQGSFVTFGINPCV